MSCRMMNRAIATALEQLSRTRRRRAVAEMKIVERRGEAGVDQEIDDFLLGFTRRAPKSRAQRRNRIAPAALAEVRPAQVEIGFAVFGIAPRCLFQIRHRFSKSSLIEQRQAVVKTILSRAEMGQRAGAHECNDKGQNHDGASVFHGETPSPHRLLDERGRKYERALFAEGRLEQRLQPARLAPPVPAY